jgi:hypothetical protein
MEVFKTVPKEDIEMIKKYGLASVVYQINEGLRDCRNSVEIFSDSIVLMRANSIFFGLDKLRLSTNSVQIAYEVNPDLIEVYNCDLATGTLAVPDSRYISSKMSLSNFLKRREQNLGKIADPINASPLDISPQDFWEGRNINPLNYRFYNPEVLIKREVIPFSELRFVD